MGRDLWHIFAPDHPAATEQSSAPAPVRPVIDRPQRPDPRKMLPRLALAESDPASWFTADDYPQAALRDNLQGPVTFHYVIGPDGLARDCRVTKTSGSVVLDGTACEVFTLRARYWPARDKAGNPVFESSTQTVRWQIPDN